MKSPIILILFLLLYSVSIHAQQPSPCVLLDKLLKEAAKAKAGSNYQIALNKLSSAMKAAMTCDEGNFSCNSLNILMIQASIYEAKKDYKYALNKLNSARIAARNCTNRDVNLVDSRIDRVYKEIFDLKRKAEEDRKKAEDSEAVALAERVKAQQAERSAKSAALKAVESARAALQEKNKADSAARLADRAAQKADSSARITEASRLQTLALQVKDNDPTLALQLIKQACDTTYFNYEAAIEVFRSIVSTTQPASFYLNKVDKMDEDVSHVVLSENGKHLIVGSYSGSIDVWDLAKTSESGVGNPTATVNGHSGAVLSLATSLDGSVVVSGGTDGIIHRWNDKLEKQPISFAKDTGAVLSLAISADKQYLVSSGEDKTVKVWNLTSGTLEKKLALTYGDGLQVCFSPDGKYVGIAGNDEVIRVWDWQSGKVVAVLEGHAGAVRSVAFSADGNYIVSGGDDKTIKVWDWNKSTVIHSLQGHQSSVMSVAFSSDKAYIVSASQDKTIKVWDLQSKRVYRELRGHQKAVFATGFYSNSRYIYSGSYDNSVKLWDWKQDYMLNPPVKHSQSAENSLVGSNKVFSLRDTTLLNQYIVTQGSDKTIWFWDSLQTSRPVYILHDRKNNEQSRPINTGIAIINSAELYQSFYQKLIRINGKLIPALAPSDRLRYFSNTQ